MLLDNTKIFRFIKESKALWYPFQGKKDLKTYKISKLIGDNHVAFTLTNWVTLMDKM